MLFNPSKQWLFLEKAARFGKRSASSSPECGGAKGLTGGSGMIDIPIMQTATVADLRNNFRRVSNWIKNGESVEISRRGKKFAHLMPTVAAPAKLVKADFAKQMREVWGTRVFSDAEMRAMREAELGDRS